MREFTAWIADKAQAQDGNRAPSTKDPAAPHGAKRDVHIDIDGFFVPMTEMGKISLPEVIEALPLIRTHSREFLALHQLFRSSLVLTNRGSRDEDQALLRWWSETSVLFSLVALQRGAPNAPNWLTWYSKDLHEHFLRTETTAAGSHLRLTLDPRLTAQTSTRERRVTISATTREYLLRINVYLAILAEVVIEDRQVLTSADSEEFFEFVCAYIARLHSDLHPSHLPVVRPTSRDTFMFALEITQTQIEFLLAHEFAHLRFRRDEASSREQLEDRCDQSSYEFLAGGGRKPWIHFLAVRWLFEILAFDRVYGECLAFHGQNWLEGIDWYQDGLRDRWRRLFEQHPAGDFLSLYENVGSVFLLDLKGRLCTLGPLRLRQLHSDLRSQEAVPGVQDLHDRTLALALKHLSSGPISIGKVP